MKLRDYLDPDRDWRSVATLQHFVVCFVLSCLFVLLLPAITWVVLGAPTLAAFLLVLWTALVYEAGQTDTAYSLRDGSGRRYAGQPGYGFGLMDVAAGMLGATLFLVVRFLYHAVWALSR